MAKKQTKEEFIEKARKVHGDKYDYSKVNYVNNATKVCIICPIHGEFWQIPASHLMGRACPECRNTRISNSLRNNVEAFIEKAKKVHGDKYDYSKVKYVNNKTKICIVCPEHGEFWQTPDGHLSGHGCRECYYKELSKRQTPQFDEVEKKMKELHNNFYSYDKESYKNNHTKMRIICPIHGEFWQTPNSHLNGNGCKRCGGKEVFSFSDFLEKAKKVHGDKYDYSKVEYKGVDTKVCIICPKHGEFWQTPHSHLNGNGCPNCRESHLEREVDLYLFSKGIEYIRGKKNKWLGKQHLDFYLPQYNAAIECQGEQHFGLGGWAKNGRLKKINELDKRKHKLCSENSVKLFYYSNVLDDIFLGEKVYHNINELMEEITKK